MDKKMYIAPEMEDVKIESEFILQVLPTSGGGADFGGEGSEDDF